MHRVALSVQPKERGLDHDYGPKKLADGTAILLVKELSLRAGRRSCKSNREQAMGQRRR